MLLLLLSIEMIWMMVAQIIFKKVVNQTRKKNPNTTIEVLTPDFLRKGDAYKKLLEADLDVFNHNIETVPRLYLKVKTRC